jgi:hypothetical protein
MKTTRRVAIFTFWCIVTAPCVSYACATVPTINIEPYTEFMNPGDGYDFTASVVAGDPADDWEWTGGNPDWSEYSDHSQGWGHFYSTGKQCVTATAFNAAGSYTTSAYVWVFRMDLDIAGVSEEAEANPGKFLAVGDTAQLDLSYLPSNLGDSRQTQRLSVTWPQTTIKVKEGTSTIIYENAIDKIWTPMSPSRTLTVEGCTPGVATLYHYFRRTNNSYPGSANWDTVKVTVVGLNVSPSSGPIGTVVTLTVTPSGLGLLSENASVTITGRYTPQGQATTTETTIEYPSAKTYYDPARPDEVKIVVGDVLPDASWLAANPQVYLADSGTLTGEVSLHMTGVTITTASTFNIYSQTELGTIEGTTFAPVDLIESGQVLVAQVLVKDDGLGSPPDSFNLTIQSYDGDGNPITAPPSEGYAGTSLTLTAARVTTGGVPGFHTYQSPPDAPIMPYAFVLPLGVDPDGGYIYIVDGGSLKIIY